MIKYLPIKYRMGILMREERVRSLQNKEENDVSNALICNKDQEAIHEEKTVW